MITWWIHERAIEDSNIITKHYTKRDILFCLESPAMHRAMLKIQRPCYLQSSTLLLNLWMVVEFMDISANAIPVWTSDDANHIHKIDVILAQMLLITLLLT
jgi:hypothetical protein